MGRVFGWGCPRYLVAVSGILSAPLDSYEVILAPCLPVSYTPYTSLPIALSMSQMAMTALVA